MRQPVFFDKPKRGETIEEISQRFADTMIAFMKEKAAERAAAKSAAETVEPTTEPTST